MNQYIVNCATDLGTSVEKVWARAFDNALEAVKCYESFVDHGFCVLEQVVTLSEPNGKIHTKVFKYPYDNAAEYEAACVKWRDQQFDPYLQVK